MSYLHDLVEAYRSALAGTMPAVIEPIGARASVLASEARRLAGERSKSAGGTVEGTSEP